MPARIPRAAVAVAALFLTACGSPGGTAPEDGTRRITAGGGPAPSGIGLGGPRTDGAPAEADPCPASGIRITADDGDAAMGLRVVGLRLENCGTRPYDVDGHPLLSLLDEDWRPVPGVRVVHGSGGIATVAGFDDPPGAVTLRPGESASAGLMWRNTTGHGTAVRVLRVAVTAKAGSPPVIVAPGLDLGTTGVVGVGPWKKDG
jgi:hypothetical protein